MKLIYGILFWVSCLTAVGQTSSISLVSDVWPPFTNQEGKLSIANDLVQTALERMEVSSSVTVAPFDSVLAYLKSNTYNGSAALWKTKERESYLLFSEPFLQNQLMLVGLKGAEVNDVSLGFLSGKRVGGVLGYAYSDRLLSGTGIIMVYSENDQRNVEKLFAKQVDYLIVDKLVLNYMLKHELNNVSDALAISAQPFATKSMHFAVSKQLPNSQEIIDGFNSQMDEMLKDGSFHSILGMNWIEADVNHDGITELVLKGEMAGEIAPEEIYALFYKKPNAASKQYYINGAYYSTWEEVPERFKSNPRHTPALEDYSPGIRIKF